MSFEQDDKLYKQDIKSFEQHIKSSEQVKKQNSHVPSRVPYDTDADREIPARGIRIMPETSFPALSVYRGLGFHGLHRRPMFDYFCYDFKICYLSFVISIIFDILLHITIFSKRHSVFSWWCKSGVTSEIEL